MSHTHTTTTYHNSAVNKLVLHPLPIPGVMRVARGRITRRNTKQQSPLCRPFIRAHVAYYGSRRRRIRFGRSSSRVGDISVIIVSLRGIATPGTGHSRLCNASSCIPKSSSIGPNGKGPSNKAGGSQEPRHRDTMVAPEDFKGGRRGSNFS